MTNLLILLLLGGAVGWAVTAIPRDFRAADALINISLGSVISFLPALTVNDGALYGGLSAVTCASAAAAALLGVGACALAKRYIRLF